MDINDKDQKCYPPEKAELPTCTDCDFFEPCAKEGCHNPDDDPHGFCYVQPPVYVGGGGARGVQTWANNRGCRFHPVYLSGGAKTVLNALREAYNRMAEEEEVYED